MSQVRIKLIKSPIGRKPSHRDTVRGLGFTKCGQTVEHELTPQIKGMVKQVEYLLDVKEVAQ